MTFDDQYRAQLGPRPPLTRGIPSAANREWDLRYQALFPSAALPVYHPKRRKPELSDAEKLEKRADKLLKNEVDNAA